MNKYKFYIILSWAAVISAMIIIFILSSQDHEQSKNFSMDVSKVIVDIIKSIVPNVEIDIKSFNDVIRKFAHFFMYLVLEILILNTLKKSGIKGYRAVLLSAIACIIYAASDEFHQLFVQGRGGKVTDILIDSAGVIVGIFVYIFINKIINHKIQKIQSIPKHCKIKRLH